MTAAERVLGYFDRISEAPYAGGQIRRFVLDLAMRGKLLPQNPTDHSSDECLASARAAVAKKAEETRRQRWTPSEPIAPSELPRAVPAGWLPARVNDTALYVNGLAFKPSDWKPTGTPIIRIQNLTDPSKEFNYADGEFPDEVIVRDGDILVSWSATLEAFEWKRGECVLNQHIFRVLPVGGLTTPRFLYLLLRHAIREMADSRHAHGLVMAHINRGPFLAHVVLIPPMAEQHRIVAKFDELMGLCDRLEAAQAERERRRDRVTTASLSRLNQPSPEAPTFREHVRFHLDHLPKFITERGNTDQLRQTILSLGVRGRLVQQDAAEGSASDLLGRIAVEKARQQRTGALKKQQAPARVDFVPEPFEVPPSWRWVKMDDCFAVGGGIQKTPARTPKDNSYPYVGVGNVYRGRLDLSELKRFELLEGDLERFQLIKGDILVVEGNGSANEIGRCAMWNGEVPDCVHQNHIIRCRPFDLRIAQYVLRYLNSPNGIEAMQRLAITTSGLFSLSVGKIRTIAVPLPPLSEQHRIVAKIDELMAVCDRLDVSIASVQAESQHLLNAVLHDALAPHCEWATGGRATVASL